MTDTGLPARDAEEYLGDGLYARFDGWHIMLRAPRDDGDHWVALEPKVFHALMQWIRRHRTLARHVGVSE